MRRAAAVLLLALVLPAVPGCRAFEPDFGRFDVPEVRPLRDRAAQHDALVELRLEQVLPGALEASGIDCWLVVSRAIDPDPVFRWLVRTATEPDGRAVLSLCRGDAGVVRWAWGPGLEAVDGLYETAAAPGHAPGPALREHLEGLDPAVIGVDRSPGEPWADGLAATDATWLQEALGESLGQRVVSASPLVQRFLGEYLDSEATLFTEAARLTDAILHEVLSDREVVAAGTSVEDLRWAFRRRAGQRLVEVVVQPRAEIWRQGQTLEAEMRMEQDLLLQPGDLVFLGGGIRYLDYAVHLGRWAYLLPEGDLEPPAWVPEAMDALAGDLEAGLGEVVPGAPRDRVLAGLGQLSRDRGLRTARVGRLGRLFDHPDPRGAGFHGPEMARLGSRTGQADASGSAIGAAELYWTLDPPVVGPGPLVLEVSRRLRPPGWEEQELELTLREAIWVGPAGGRAVIPIQRSPYLID